MRSVSSSYILSAGADSAPILRKSPKMMGCLMNDSPASTFCNSHNTMRKSPKMIGCWMKDSAWTFCNSHNTMRKSPKMIGCWMKDSAWTFCNSHNTMSVGDTLQSTIGGSFGKDLFCRNKSFVATNTCKTHLLSQQNTYFCRDKNILLRQT